MGLPRSSGHLVILTIVDRFSKADHFVPLPKVPSAFETALLLVDDGLSLCRVWKRVLHSFGVGVSLSLGYHSQSNGQTERTNQQLESVLCCLVSVNPASRTNCTAAAGFGARPRWRCFRLQHKLAVRQIGGDLPLLYTPWDKRCGCPLQLFL